MEGHGGRRHRNTDGRTSTLTFTIRIRQDKQNENVLGSNELQNCIWIKKQEQVQIPLMRHHQTKDLRNEFKKEKNSLVTRCKI